METSKPDYLLVGSGIATMVFGALMAQAGKKVLILEAHEFAGGYGHTFEMANKYKFNAQLHYVWNCGEGETVHQVLTKLGLEKEVRFLRYDPDRFDHMYMPGYKLEIPSYSEELVNRLEALFPGNRRKFDGFMKTVNRVSHGLSQLSSPIRVSAVLKNLPSVYYVWKHRRDTLQDVFDQFQLPKAAQTLIASQWPDFLLPPNQLSFFAWVMLFTGYQRGAYYPEKHFEHVIDSLRQVIESHGGEILFEHEVSRFHYRDGAIHGVDAKNLKTGEELTFEGGTTICGMDPQQAAHWIGMDKFAPAIQQKLKYDYSPSNFVAYLVVRDLDMRDYGFGKWNVFHSEHEDLNEAFDLMYDHHDYSKPSFAITTPTLLTDVRGDCPPGDQIVELLTVANYDYWKMVKEADEKAYKKAKMEILEIMIKIIERDYVPNFREHLVFKMTGSPTTNERYCWTAKGNSYGSNMTPENIGMNRLDYRTSIKNFYFCNASSGYAGFAGTFWTGAHLYEQLSKDKVW